jgi:hypothetical protein
MAPLTTRSVWPATRAPRVGGRTPVLLKVFGEIAVGDAETASQGRWERSGSIWWRKSVKIADFIFFPRDLVMRGVAPNDPVW